MNRVEIELKVSIVAKQAGRYAAFPTLVKIGNRVWLACRKGLAASNIPHGDKGRLFLYYADVNNLSQWQGIPVVFNQTHALGNELDAIISYDGQNTITLISRHYRSSIENIPYISYLHIDDLERAVSGIRPIILDRFDLNKMLAENNQETAVAAMFGHALCTDSGKQGGQLLSCYAVVESGQMPSPVVLRSMNSGQSWYRHSVIANSREHEIYLNETSIIRSEGKKYLSVIRTDNKPWPLYFSISNGGAENWSALSETGLTGHAPMLVKGENETVFLFYRDLSGDRPAVSMACFQASEWVALGQIASYQHIYNGGYSDAIHLGSNRFFVVSYFDDEDGCPWIDGYIVKVLE